MSPCGRPEADAPQSAATQRLAEWIASCGAAVPPAHVEAHAQRLLADYLGSTIAGTALPLTTALRGYARDVSSAEQAAIVGHGRLSAPAAALVNGTAAHALELDDGYTLGGSHPSAATLPAVLAAAERHRAGPAVVLRAAATAVEVACRVAAAGHPATWRAGFHNTALAGVFGAAAGVCVVLQADDVEVASALGLCGSRAAGLFEFLRDGADTKAMHPGQAAQDGLVAAELAVRGVRGPRTVFEGSYGYYNAYARGAWDEATLTGGLGERWHLLRTYVKPYPCCRHLHAPIDAALELRGRHRVDVREISRIVVETFTGAARHDGKVIDSMLSAQMSIPYAVAIALRRGRVGLPEFAAVERADPDTLRLAQAVEVCVTEDCERDYPAMRPARVTIYRRDAEPVALRVDQPYGEPDNPMSVDAIKAKFRALATPVLGAARSERVLDAAGRFDAAALGRELSGPLPSARVGR